VAGSAAWPEPESGPPAPGSWRSGLGCCLAVLSVVALLLVGQVAGSLIHRPGADAPVAGTAVDLARRLDRLPPAAQSVPATAAGVASLLASVGLPTSTARQAEYRSGRTVIAIGMVGDCVFVDVHRRRLTAWPAPELSPCTAALAYRSMLARRRRLRPGPDHSPPG